MLKDYQLLTAFNLCEKLKQKKLAALYAPPRIGKSLIALKAAELFGAKNILILTKKAAIKGWMQYCEYFNFSVINYEAVAKWQGDADFIIVDESHNFNAFPKCSERAKNIKKLARGLPILLLSGTPSSEGTLGLFSQFKLSSFTPTGDMNAYDFFYRYGVPLKIMIGGVPRELYKNCREHEVRAIFNEFIITLDYTQTDINYQHSDKSLIIKESEDFYNIVSQIRGGVFADTPLPTPPSRLNALHQLESGIFNDEVLFESEKIKWLKNFIKPTETYAVMAYFVSEQKLLNEIFGEYANVIVLSSTKYCEGVDLSDYDNFILYSFGYSGAKFIQLRERVVNINKNKETYAIIPIIKNGVSERVYNVVSKKQNFNKNMLINFLNEKVKK